MEIALSLLLGLLLIAVIIAINGYFVAQEFSYMAVDRSQLKAQAEEGSSAARRTLRITDRTSFMLSGAQLGITVTGLLVGYVAEPLVGSAIGELLGRSGVPAPAGVAVGTVGVLVVATFAQMLFAELFPKNLAIARPYEVALALARSTHVYMRAFGWLIRIFDGASNALLRLLRIEPVHDVGHSANIHDLVRIVTLSRDAGRLPADLSLVLDRMLDFPQRDVAHGLVPRSRVDVVPAGTDLREVLETMEGGHSRYPVLDAEGDVVGVVHLIDVMDAFEQAEGGGRTPSLEEISRPAVVVPIVMPLPDVLALLSGEGRQLACAVDEYGGFVGIVTVEDLVEEIVGELTDEHDPDEEAHLVAGDDAGQWTVRGDAPLDEVEREIGVPLSSRDAVTVAGLVIAARQALPAEGEVVDVTLPPDPVELAHDEDAPERTLRVTVLEVGRHVPTLVRVELLGPEDVVGAGPAATEEGGS
ncbi:MAG: hemolysin family protein [Nocardioides sp.]|nr:hemolysin family protein [Nocardioides sp.]